MLPPKKRKISYGSPYKRVIKTLDELSPREQRIVEKRLILKFQQEGFEETPPPPKKKKIYEISLTLEIQRDRPVNDPIWNPLSIRGPKDTFIFIITDEFTMNEIMSFVLKELHWDQKHDYEFLFLNGGKSYNEKLLLATHIPMEEDHTPLVEDDLYFFDLWEDFCEDEIETEQDVEEREKLTCDKLSALHLPDRQDFWILYDTNFIYHEFHGTMKRIPKGKPQYPFIVQKWKQKYEQYPPEFI